MVGRRPSYPTERRQTGGTKTVREGKEQADHGPETIAYIRSPGLIHIAYSDTLRLRLRAVYLGNARLVGVQPAVPRAADCAPKPGRNEGPAIISAYVSPW